MMNARDLQTVAKRAIEKKEEETRKLVAKKYAEYIGQCEEQANLGKFECQIDTTDMLNEEIAILEKTFLVNGFSFKRLDAFADYILISWNDAKDI